MNLPRLEHWRRINYFGVNILTGLIYEDNRFKDGTVIFTSHIQNIVFMPDVGLGKTQNTLYFLGKHSEEPDEEEG